MGGTTKRAAPRPAKVVRRAPKPSASAVIADLGRATTDLAAGVASIETRTAGLRRDLDAETSRIDQGVQRHDRLSDQVGLLANALRVTGLVTSDPKDPAALIAHPPAFPRERSALRIACAVAGALAVMVASAFLGAWLFVQTL